MLYLRKSSDRGYYDHGWLESYHSFSFSSYFDPKFVGFGPLRVINEDYVQEATGFGTHGHRDMEILTYMLEGELSHRDSLGNGSTIHPGQIQRMTAGSGIQHSEMNRSTTERAHLLQIWIEPNETGLDPSYKDHTLVAEQLHGQLALVATGDAEQAATLDIAHIHQDVRVYAAKLNGGEVKQALSPERLGYVHLAKGSARVNGQVLSKGDALMIAKEDLLEITDADNAELLFFDLPETGFHPHPLRSK